jgi:hypothetical protein
MGERYRRAGAASRPPAANVGAAEQTPARREGRVVAGGADDRLHCPDDDGRLAAAW